jgi:hypothetical protein
MKKLSYLSGVILLFLSSCQKQEDLVLNTEATVSEQTEQTTKLKSASTTATSYMNVVFNVDFSKNPVGSYSKSLWYADWNHPYWANSAIGYGKIEASGSNKYLKETFPKGTFLLTGAGTQWEAILSKGYDELYLTYKVKFSKGFTNKNYHGKLPGLAGGKSSNAGYLPTGKDGWTARYMFHGTSINFYLYYPDMYKEYGDKAPVSKKNYYGVGKTLSPGYTLQPEVWYTITQRIVMNTLGKRDGLVEGFINGKLCATQTGLRFRDISTLQIDRVFFSNFFGGSGIKPVQTEYISFDDFYVYTYSSSVKVARGKSSNPAGTQIQVP